MKRSVFYTQKCARTLLSIIAVMATIFANMTCRGRCYEPIVPKKLQKAERE